MRCVTSLGLKIFSDKLQKLVHVFVGYEALDEVEGQFADFIGFIVEDLEDVVYVGT